MKLRLRGPLDKGYQVTATVEATPVTVDACDAVLALHESKLDPNRDEETNSDPFDIWRVTEPRTGLWIAYGATRKQALANANVKIALESRWIDFEEVIECVVRLAKRKYGVNI